MATIQDVAAAAGVSVATVSRVLNHSNTVSPKSTQKVLRAIQELSYKPNMLARDLRRAETRRVLVLLQTISNPFYATIVKGIEDVANKCNYNVMLCNTDSNVNREQAYIELLEKKLADGLILLNTEFSVEKINELSAEYPVVICCEYISGMQVPHVSIDNFEAAKTAMKHLLNLGHKRIGLICGDHHLCSTMDRLNGYRVSLEGAGLPYNKELVVEAGENTFKNGMRAMEQLLHLSERPTAVFAMSDSLAIGAMKTALNKGLRVPDDLAVMGFDGISFSSVVNPTLSTITQPRYDLGRTSMEVLINRIKGKIENSFNLILEHELSIRESTMKI